MVVRQSLVIAQRATIVQPLVRPVLGRHAQGNVDAPHFWQRTATLTHIPPITAGGGMLRVKGAGQNSQCVRILFVYVVGVPVSYTHLTLPTILRV